MSVFGNMHLTRKASITLRNKYTEFLVLLPAPLFWLLKMSCAGGLNHDSCSIECSL